LLSSPSHEVTRAFDDEVLRGKEAKMRGKSYPVVIAFWLPRQRYFTTGRSCVDDEACEQGKPSLNGWMR
jgi:hypothetical protein